MTETCDSIRDDLPLFLVGELDDVAADAIRAHLAECPACCDELEFQQRVLDRLRDEPLAPSPLRSPRTARRRLVAAAAGFVLAFAGGVLVGHTMAADDDDDARPTTGDRSSVARRAAWSTIAAMPSDLGRGLRLLRQR